MKSVLIVLGYMLLIITLAYGGWKLERWLNYKMSYSPQVEKQMEPLMERVIALEKKISELEKK